MTGGWRTLWRRLVSGWTSRLAVVTVALLVAVGLGADCLASDLPIAVRYQGETYLFPNITRPGALRQHDNHTLMQALHPGEWALHPLIPYGPDQTRPGGDLDVNEPPGSAHPLGTDDVGRDVAAQLVHGARVALIVGLGSVIIFTLFGILLGGLAGYLRGPVDGVVNWLVATLMTFPSFLLVLAIQGLVTAQTLLGVVLVLGLTGWAGVARLVRGEVLRISSEPYVLAARGLGASHARILGRHVLPGAMGPVLVAATFGMASAIMVESGLSFLGLGPDAPSWGRLLAMAQVNRGAWWLTLFPGIAISLTVLAYNFVAEGLQDALDPRRGTAPVGSGPFGRGPAMLARMWRRVARGRRRAG